MKSQKRRFARKLTILLLAALAAACSVEGENGAQEGVKYCWTYDTETGDVTIEVKAPFAGGEVYEYDANGNFVGSHQFSGAVTSFTLSSSTSTVAVWLNDGSRMWLTKHSIP